MGLLTAILHSVTDLVVLVGMYWLWFSWQKAPSVRTAIRSLIGVAILGAVATRTVWRPTPGLETAVQGVVLALGVPAVVVGAALWGRRRDERRDAGR